MGEIFSAGDVTESRSERGLLCVQIRAVMAKAPSLEHSRLLLIVRVRVRVRVRAFSEFGKGCFKS